ncbi:hypothetical protein BG015_002501 [Linnemannia schmuckeri]|uniref:Uncharacterized protein n=1 Tax=Linnemannia schmuckeri TaxID=64567 RepID=A0A9P5VFM6_9FUNG|nr:hypothetical protein BG015_002501 [Linnemannia schmuckeri]
METIYGIQADTDTLREAHEHQRRMQQRLQEQQSSVPEPSAASKKTGLSMLKPSTTGATTTMTTTGGLAKSSPIARSTSTSALPPSTMMHHSLNAAGSTSVTGYSTPGSTGGTDTGYSSPYFAGSAATSPFLTAVDHHHHHHHTHSSGPAQLRSTTHSPALFSKFYDVEHRLPWLSLPGAVGSPALSASTSGGSIEGPTSMFGRRRSDVGLSSSETSTPSGLDLGSSSLLPSQSHQDGSSSQQEASFPQPPQPQPQVHAHHHHHAQYLLGPQELAALSRHNSPMPLNEALPHYLRKKSVDSMHSMERSFSNPGTNGLHPSPHAGSSFMLPLGSSTATNSGSHAGGSVGQAAAAAAASPSHLLFAFPGSTAHPTTAATVTSSSNRPEMERASSTGVLPMMHRPSPHPQQKHAQSHLGTITTNSGPGSTSASNNCNNNGVAASSTLVTGTGSAASFFRTLTPAVHHHHHHHHASVGLGAITGLDASSSSHSHSGTSTPSKLFGNHANSNDRDLPSNKEVHA